MTVLPPIRDLLAETLDEVSPFFIFRIGELEFQCWKPEHIAEAHNLRYVKAQVELMILGRQYQQLVEELNTLSLQDTTNADEQIKINNLTQKMGDVIRGMMPLNASYIEALTETKSGSFLNIIKIELSKKNPRKDIPLALFINTVREEINKALEFVSEASTNNTNGDLEKKEQIAITETEQKLISGES